MLDAAEKWHVAGNTAEEERVRAWEKNIKTEAEFRASFPDQPPNKYISTDPYAQWPGTREVWPGTEEKWPGQEISGAGLREAESRREWDAEEAQCRAPLRYPPVKWDHQTEFGKTFAIVQFRERKAGDRKKELDGYAKAIGARFYKQWSRVRQGGADWVEIVFYK